MHLQTKRSAINGVLNSMYAVELAKYRREVRRWLFPAKESFTELLKSRAYEQLRKDLVDARDRFNKAFSDERERVLCWQTCQAMVDSEIHPRWVYLRQKRQAGSGYRHFQRKVVMLGSRGWDLTYLWEYIT